MTTRYKVEHKGKTREFETEEEAINLALALEEFGYKVKVYRVDIRLYKDDRVLLYETNEIKINNFWF